MAGRGGKQPGGGRPKGSVNIKSLTVGQYFESIGYDALGMLAKSAHSADEAVALRARIEIASFMYPKLRSVEIRGTLTTVTTQREIEAASDRQLLETLMALEHTSDDDRTDAH